MNDARATAADGFSITLANLQFAGSLQFGRYRTLSGDISVQRTWQRLEPLPLTDEPAQNDPLRLLTPLRLGQTSASANLVYTDNRFVNVPRLRFVSEVRVTTTARSATATRGTAAAVRRTPSIRRRAISRHRPPRRSCRARG